MVKLRSLLAVFLPSLAIAQATQGDEAPRRVRLFDRMAEARVVDLPAPSGDPVRETWSEGFDAEAPARAWFARVDGRSLRLEEGGVAIDPAAGRTGAGLRIGPEVPENLSRALLLVPSGPLRRVRIQGRARLAGHPDPESSAAREVLRVAEHKSELEEPANRDRRLRSSGLLRVSRRIDPSGWDSFDLVFVTGSETRTLELHLLHQSGDSPESTTVFDDLVVEQTTLGGAEALEHVRATYRPRDGREAETPWRVRVELEGEVRDALLLPPPARVELPVRVPPAESAPLLRFHAGMSIEGGDGDDGGARLAVSFRGEDGTDVPLGAVTVDRRQRASRGWIETRIDLTPLAGRAGQLVFAAADLSGEPEPLDTLLLATPRIEPAREVPGAFNVLLIGVDTLRADRTSAFGYERPTTPHLAALADEGVRFTNTRSQAPWTLPSFSTALTSLYPSVHGAGRGGHDEWTPIDPTTTALAEVLARVGYQTQGIVANGLISPHYGLDQGFEAYAWGWAMESVQRDVPRVVEFIDAHRTTPWLLFWHIMDPHLPYSTEDGYREAFTDAAYDGRFATRSGAYVPFEVLDPRPGRRWYTHEGPPPAPDLEEEDRAFVSDYYDAEVAEVDAALGRVLEALRASEQWSRTVVAFVADHGEGLLDHAHYHHGYTLFDDQVHIPLVLRVPGAHQGRVIERPVGSIDLAPTLLGALGLEAPSFFQGVDRLAEDAPQEGGLFIEYPTYDSSAQKAWVQGRFKYLHDPVFHTAALYDTVADPLERSDVSAEHPEVVAAARAALDEFRWRNLQKGRYHLRVRGERGARLSVALAIDDLFDANFATLPAVDEHAFQLDLERRNLVLETTLEAGRLELVFWGRGTRLAVDVTLSGKRPADGLQLAAEEEAASLPASLEPGRIPVGSGDEIGWGGIGSATLWLEGGVDQPLPVVLSPAEIEVLRELGYAR